MVIGAIVILIIALFSLLLNTVFLLCRIPLMSMVVLLLLLRVVIVFNFFCVMVFTDDMLRFNPERDMKPVEPFGFVDLQHAFANGVIEAQVADTDENYNGIEDPTVVIGRPRDIFDAMQAKMNIDAAASAAAVEKKDVE